MAFMELIKDKIMYGTIAKTSDSYNKLQTKSIDYM